MRDTQGGTPQNTLKFKKQFITRDIEKLHRSIILRLYGTSQSM